MKNTLLAITALFSLAILLSVGFADAQTPKAEKLVDCVPIDKTALLTQSGSVETINQTDRLVIRVLCVTDFVYFYKNPNIPQLVPITVTNPITNKTETVEIPIEFFIPKPQASSVPGPEPKKVPKVEIPISETFDKDELPVILECARGVDHWKPIQQRDRFEVVADYIFSIRKYTGETRSLALNMKWQECHWANIYKYANLGPQYQNFIVDDFPEQLKHRQVDPRTSGVIYPTISPEQMIIEEQKARETLCNASWAQGVCEEKYTTIEKSTKGTINPFSEVGKKYNKYLSMQTDTEQQKKEAQNIVCAKVWEKMAYGKSMTSRIPNEIASGQCAEYIAKWKADNGQPIGGK